MSTAEINVVKKQFWNHPQVRAYTRYGRYFSKAELKQLAAKIRAGLASSSADIMPVYELGGAITLLARWRRVIYVVVYDPRWHRIVTFLPKDGELPFSVREALGKCA